MTRILFDPDKDSQIKSAADRLRTQLTALLIDLRKDPQNKNKWEKYAQFLQDAILYTSLQAYHSGCRDVGVAPQPTDVQRLRQQAIKRATWCREVVERYTLQQLGLLAASKKSKLLGKKRSDGIVDNEVYTAFFKGKTKGWGRNKLAKKEWFLDPKHDVDDTCDDNADDGIIPMDAPFTTGDFFPPAHPNCLCRLWLHR